MIVALLLAAGWLWWQLDSKTEELGGIKSDLEHSQAAVKSIRSTLKLQREVTADAEAESQQGAQDVEQIRNDIAADDTADRLRDQLDQLRRRSSFENAGLATELVTARQTIGVLTYMLEECSGFAGVVAGAYEEARARGLTCQRVYEGVRAKVNE